VRKLTAAASCTPPADVVEVAQRRKIAVRPIRGARVVLGERERVPVAG
jgi:hypothetical protein